MKFKRSFECLKINKLDAKKAELWGELKKDVLAGEVFPAVRVNEIHFYYKGGCLYKFNGSSFPRDEKYENYSAGTTGLEKYEKHKQQNKNRFKSEDDLPRERQLLDELNCYTFGEKYHSDVVVLDIEVRLNGEIYGNKKM